MTRQPELLRVRDIQVEYKARGGKPPFRAVDGVSFSIDRGETLGLVGESGSGKSTIAKAILHLAPASGGSIQFEGRDVTHVSRQARRELSSKVQVVFQDPYSSFNPSRTIESSLCEMLRPHGRTDRKEARRRATELLDLVGVRSSALTKYPGEFSGGQRQRIAIARALMVNPSLLICDEAVSALDLSVQAQVINLLREIQQEVGLAMLFISHDLTVVELVSQRVMVLYRGRIMETGAASAVHAAPAHPYSRLLMDAIPVPDPSYRDRRPVRPMPTGERSSDACVFAPRCPHATDVCEEVPPSFVDVDRAHVAACHHTEAVLRRGEASGQPVGRSL